jgi:hypothetical protein
MTEISSCGNEASLLAWLWFGSVVMTEILSCCSIISLVSVTDLAMEVEDI